MICSIVLCEVTSCQDKVPGRDSLFPQHPCQAVRTLTVIGVYLHHSGVTEADVDEGVG